MNAAQQALAQLSRATGRIYPELAKVLAEQGDNPALVQELHRMVREVEDAVHMAKRQGAKQPWRHGGFSR